MSPPFSRRNFLKRIGGAVTCASAFQSSLIPQVQQVLGKLEKDTPAQSLVTDLTKHIPEWMNKWGVPGLSVALIRNAQIIWSQGFGIKSKSTKEPVSVDTVFEAASLSKPAFAYVVLKLIEEGKLGLDTPLAQYLPAPFNSDEARLKLITARMVLSHSSGLPHGRAPGTPVSLRFTPGKQFAYSATGIQYLQRVVGKLTQQSLADLMRENLLKPFSMASSSFGWIGKYENEAAQGYGQKGEPGLSGNGRYLQASAEEKERMHEDFPEYQYPSASAGLYTTASDYARFMIEIIQPATKDHFHLSEELMLEMLRPQVKINDALSWGLGWGLEHTDSGDAFWHWGDWGVFRNFALASRKQRLGVVVLTNSFNGPKVYREIVPQAIGGNHPALSWVESYHP
jgi:CubicO group peptidase (beta-lactamase class C family)